MLQPSFEMIHMYC